MVPQSRHGRVCSRVSCRAVATMTLTYIYADSTAVLGPLATFAEPHSYDLCDKHSARLTVPNGWEVIRHVAEMDAAGPSDDDLMAIADAVREAASAHLQPAQSEVAQVAHSSVGRRGHLRAVPS
jgi:hypothetical protein